MVNGTIQKFGHGFLFTLHINYSPILYHIREKRNNGRKSLFFIPPVFDAPITRSIAIMLGMENENGVATQWWQV